MLNITWFYWPITVCWDISCSRVSKPQHLQSRNNLKNRIRHRWMAYVTRPIRTRTERTKSRATTGIRGTHTLHELRRHHTLRLDHPRKHRLQKNWPYFLSSPCCDGSWSRTTTIESSSALDPVLLTACRTRMTNLWQMWWTATKDFHFFPNDCYYHMWWCV